MTILHFVDKTTNSNILLVIFNYFNMNSNLMKLQATAFRTSIFVLTKLRITSITKIRIASMVSFINLHA